MLSQRSVWSLGLVIAVLLGAPPVVAGPSEPAPAGTRVRVIQFNICGALCNDGEVDRPGEGNDVVEHVAGLVEELRPHVVVLNEVCRAQLQRLARLLAAAGTPASVAFHPQRRTDAQCPEVNGEQGFGDAVLASGPAGARQVHTLPNPTPGGEERAIVCLEAVPGPRLLVCALHLTAGNDHYRERQLDRVIRFSRERAPSARLVVAGDFNSWPWELGRMSDPAQGGHFEDVDAGRNRPTHSRQKIDYIFFERADFHSPWAQVRSSPYSDHRLLFGAFSVRDGAGSRG